MKTGFGRKRQSFKLFSTWKFLYDFFFSKNLLLTYFSNSPANVLFNIEILEWNITEISFTSLQGLLDFSGHGEVDQASSWA